MTVLAGSKKIIIGDTLSLFSFEEIDELLTAGFSSVREEVKECVEPLLRSGLRSVRSWEMGIGEGIDFLDLGKKVGIKDLLLDSHNYCSVFSLLRVVGSTDPRFRSSIQARPFFALSTVVRVTKGERKGSYIPFAVQHHWGQSHPPFSFGFHSTRELFPEDALFLIRHKFGNEEFP